MQVDITIGKRQNKAKLRLVTPFSPATAPESPRQKIKKPLILRAADRAELTTQTADAILAAVVKRQREYPSREAMPDELLRAEKRALEMAHCGEMDNHIVGRDFHTQSDNGPIEFFNAKGVLNCCGSPLCLSHIERERRKLRKRTIRAFEAYELQAGEAYLFITLTHTVMPELRKVEAVKLQNKAFRYWQDSVFYQRNIKGGSRSVETTTKAGRPGYHVHSHLTVVLTPSAAATVANKSELDKFNGEWLRDLKSSWTRAVISAARKLGHVVPEPDTADGYYICDARPVYLPDHKQGRVKNPLRAALIEGIKYSLKSQTIKNILKNEDQLLELAGSRERAREFEIFGCVRAADQERRQSEKNEREAEHLNLDTGVLNAEISPADKPVDPERGRMYRERIEKRKARIMADIHKAYTLGDYTEGVRYADGKQAETLICEYLGAMNKSGLFGPVVSDITARSRDWRVAVGELIRAERSEVTLGGKRRLGRMERDLRLTRAEYERNAGIEWRLRQGFAMYRLARRYPWAEFRTLAGEVFEGVRRYEMEDRAVA